MYTGAHSVNPVFKIPLHQFCIHMAVLPLQKKFLWESSNLCWKYSIQSVKLFQKFFSRLISVFPEELDSGERPCILLGLCRMYLTFFFLIEVAFSRHKINCFHVSNSVALCILTALCSHHFCLVPDISITPKATWYLLNSNSTFHLPQTLLDSHQCAVSLCGFT